MCHADVDMRRPVETLCRQRSYRMVIVDNTMLEYFIPTIRRLQPESSIVVVAHNFETSMARQVADVQTRLARRIVFTLGARSVLRAEVRACRNADIVLATSEDDRRSFAELVPDCADKLRVVPSFIDASAYTSARVEPTPEASIVFPGDMGFFPNVTGALHFYTNIFPAIRSRHPHLRWIIAGKNCHSSIMSAVQGDSAVLVTGYVPNVLEYIARSRVVVVPLLHGSGTRLKILEAWALGRPVVSTPKGCEGMVCRHGHDILIADTPEAFADGVIRLLDAPELAREVARHGFETLLEHYDSRAVGTRLFANLHV
jgi:glycosyltransferase involved in cell wall biosynthesis